MCTENKRCEYAIAKDILIATKLLIEAKEISEKITIGLDKTKYIEDIKKLLKELE